MSTTIYGIDLTKKPPPLQLATAVPDAVRGGWSPFGGDNPAAFQNALINVLNDWLQDNVPQAATDDPLADTDDGITTLMRPDLDEVWLTWEADEIHHINLYDGLLGEVAGAAGASAGDFVAKGYADPAKHLHEVAYGSYAGDDTWIHKSDLTFAHTALYTGTGSALSGTGTATGSGNFLQTLHLDPCKHVIGADFAIPPDTTYDGDDVWIHLVGTTFHHTASYTGTGSAIASAGSVLNSITLDPCKHVIAAGFTAEGGIAYTGDGTWITLSGSTFYHTGPSTPAYVTAGGSASDYLQYAGWDQWGHIVSFSANHFTAGDVWISVAGNAWYHRTADAGTPHTACAGAGSAVKKIIYDDNGHILSVEVGPP